MDHEDPIEPNDQGYSGAGRNRGRGEMYDGEQDPERDQAVDMDDIQL
jgi:hypothetical protein